MTEVRAKEIVADHFEIDQNKLEVQSIEHYQKYVIARIFVEDDFLSFTILNNGIIESHG